MQFNEKENRTRTHTQQFQTRWECDRCQRRWMVRIGRGVVNTVSIRLKTIKIKKYIFNWIGWCFVFSFIRKWCNVFPLKWYTFNLQNYSIEHRQQQQQKRDNGLPNQYWPATLNMFTNLGTRKKNRNRVHQQQILEKIRQLFEYWIHK